MTVTENSDHSPARPALVALAAIVLFWVAEILAQIGFYGPGGEIAIWGLQGAIAQSALVVTGLLLGHALAYRMDRLLRSITLVNLLGAFLNILIWAFIARGSGPLASDVARPGLQTLVLLPQLVLLFWLMRAGLRRWVLSGLAVCAGFLGAQEAISRLAPEALLYYLPDTASDEAYVPVDVEALYASQGRLMDDQVAALAPEVPGVSDVFALALGGTSDQSVFLTEVESVSAILDAQYGSGQRTLKLANSDDDPMRYPMANRANLARALQEIGARQGAEDLAFLFLTSHGKEDLFSLEFYEAGTTDLTADEFKAMLDDSGIGAAVIVVSACHSGSFIDDIKGPDRLVITAAREDRTSFGCRDGAEWTEFGKSFFDKALRADPDPRKAFPVAAEDVGRKEAAEALTPSLPQVSEGAKIGAVLDRVLAR
jgi:hypothetical protein